MRTELNFREACKVLAGDNQPDVLDAGDKLSTFALLLVTGTSAVLGIDKVLNVALSLFDARGELFRLLSLVRKAATGQLPESSSYQVTANRILAAHVVSVYAAWFDAVKALRLHLSLASDGAELPSEATLRGWIHPQPELPPLDALGLPHPADTFTDAMSDVSKVHGRLTATLRLIIERSEVPRGDAERRAAINKALDSLPNRALSLWQQQAVALAALYPSYGEWMNLASHAETQREIREVGKTVSATKTALDVGLSRLGQHLDDIKWIASHPSDTEASHALDALGRRYRAILDKPILRPEDVADPDAMDGIVLPKISEIFVPQPFQVMRQRDGRRLDQPEVWEQLLVREDLVTWILSWLSSPHSARAPLVILGLPGSGKTLLTRILAARLAERGARPIRVELRNVVAEGKVQAQVERAVRDELDRDTRWGALRDALGPAGCVLLLDGYDELIQVGGERHRDYVEEVQRFQEDPGGDLGATPIRAIVTSRLTLIERCTVPKDAAVLRLLPFDPPRGDRWSEIWNRSNASWMSARRVKPFVVPRGSPAVVELAEQPLLLLMLAVYDAEGNALQQDADIDRPSLYDRIIRRFVKRELVRDKEYCKLSLEDQCDTEERRIQRLRLAALGMFNRGRLSIHEDELTADIQRLGEVGGQHRQDAETESPGRHLLRGFFFVHESKADVATGRATPQRAYEFLHQSFGEFLVADLLCRELIEICDALSDERARQRKVRRGEGRERSIVENAWSGSTAKVWHTAIGYRPTFRAIESLKMAQTWIRRLADSREIDPDTLTSLVSEVLEHQLRLALTARRWPDFHPDAVSAHDIRPLLLIGHMATTTLNLVTLRAVLGGSPWTLYAHWSDDLPGARAWDGLTHLWRSWTPLVELDGLREVFESERQDSGEVQVTCRLHEPGTQVTGQVEKTYAAARALGDRLLVGLVSYFRGSAGSERADSIELGWKALSHTLPELEVAFRAGRIRQISMGEPLTAKDAIALIGTTGPFTMRLRKLLEREGPITLVEVSHVLRNARQTHHLFSYFGHEQIPYNHLAMTPGALGLDLASIASQLGDVYTRELWLHRLLDPDAFAIRNIDSLSDYNLASCLRIARETDRGDHVHMLLSEADRRAALVGTARWWPAQDERLLAIYWFRGPEAFLEALAGSARRSFDQWPLDLLRTVVEAAPHAPPNLRRFAEDQSRDVRRLTIRGFRGRTDSGPSSVLLALVKAGVELVRPDEVGDIGGWSWRALHELRDVAVNDPAIKESGFIQTVDEEFARRSWPVPDADTANLVVALRRKRPKGPPRT